MAQGAAICSDGFSNATASVSINGISLDNALGGSGSRTWTASQFSGWDDGGGGAADGIRNTNANAYASIVPP